MGQSVGDDAQREIRSARYLVSRRRFLEVSVAWAAVMASFVAGGCGGEEEED